MNRYLLRAFLVLFLLAPASSAQVTEGPEFKLVAPGKTLSFPADHGAHPNYDTEWWYFTGHLRTPPGRTFGFELVFFRVGVDTALPAGSAWRTHAVYLSHLALTDDQEKTFVYFERRSRGSFGAAGAAAAGLHVWNGPSSARLQEERLELRAEENDYGLDLLLRPAKPLVLHGDNGFSRKGSAPGEASYYSSFSRLVGNGSIRIAGEEFPVSEAEVWMDHEFTTAQASRVRRGWDWFAIQLDDGRELMLYQLRDERSEKSEYSSGTLIDRDGSTRTLRSDEFRLTPRSYWQSPKTGARYPSEWDVQIPGLKLALVITPTVKDQELTTKQTTGVAYWEGRCRVSGRVAGAPARGNAYVELVGYERAGVQ